MWLIVPKNLECCTCLLRQTGQQDNCFFWIWMWLAICKLKVTSATKWWLLKMCLLKHRKNFVPFSRYLIFCIFNHPMIYQISDVTMSISTLDRIHFWIYLLNHKSWSHQTWSVDRYKQEQQFSVIFRTTWETGARFQVFFNLATCPNYSITKYGKIPVLKRWIKDN